MTSKIVIAIAKAEQHEAVHHSLEKEILTRYQSLHRAIKIVDREKVKALLSFTHRYVNLVPQILAMAEICAKETHIYDYLKPFFEATEQVFFMPLDHNEHEQESLPTLLEEAYLAHRLIEEANDRLIEKTGYPLIPIDLTTANLIAHDLIGEPYVNELDKMAVIFATKLPCIKDLKKMRAFADHIHFEKSIGHWDAVWSKWSNINYDDTLKLSIQLDS